ncbi:hypothetical protein [Streptococcus macacae]|uniref:hypothetical protein n=1 Tax=Streptococcus macacae TaxID=1339 RepID=UPI001389A6C4|nr:hypothetical protein [Streptococcus macacae]
MATRLAGGHDFALILSMLDIENSTIPIADLPTADIIEPKYYTFNCLIKQQ